MPQIWASDGRSSSFITCWYISSGFIHTFSPVSWTSCVKPVLLWIVGFSQTRCQAHGKSTYAWWIYYQRRKWDLIWHSWWLWTVLTHCHKWHWPMSAAFALTHRLWPVPADMLRKALRIPSTPLLPLVRKPRSLDRILWSHHQSQQPVGVWCFLLRQFQGSWKGIRRRKGLRLSGRELRGHVSGDYYWQHYLRHSQALLGQVGLWPARMSTKSTF